MAENLQELIDRQHALDQQLDQEISNYENDRNAKKNEFYLKLKSERIQKIVDQMELHNDIIKSFQDDSDYTKNGLIEIMRTKAKKHLRRLNDKMDSLTSNVTEKASEIVQFVSKLAEDNAAATSKTQTDLHIPKRNTATNNNSDADIDTTMKKYKLEKSKNEEARSEIEKLNERISKLNTNLASFTAIQQENIDLKGDIESLKNLRRRMISKITDLEDENERQRRQIRELETQIITQELNSSQHERSRLHTTRYSENEDEEQVKLVDILRMIPKYNGKREDLRVYISKCDELHSYVRPGFQQARFVSTIKHNLFDEAAQVLLDEDDLDTWDDIKNLLKKNFDTDSNYSNNMAMLDGLRQGRDESVETFCKKIREILAKLKSVIPKGTTKTFWFGHCEEVALRTLYDGLRDNALASRIIVEKMQTFTLASQYAIDVSTRLKNKFAHAEGVKEKRTDAYCKYCKKGGHIIEDCTLRKKNDKSKTENVAKKTEMWCEICDKSNHTTASCFKNPKNKKDKNGKEEHTKRKGVNAIETKTEKNHNDESDSEDKKSERGVLNSNTIRIKDSAKPNGWFDHLN